MNTWTNSLFFCFHPSTVPQYCVRFKKKMLVRWHSAWHWVSDFLKKQTIFLLIGTVSIHPNLNYSHNVQTRSTYKLLIVLVFLVLFPSTIWTFFDKNRQQTTGRRMRYRLFLTSYLTAEMKMTLDVARRNISSADECYKQSCSAIIDGVTVYPPFFNL